MGSNMIISNSFKRRSHFRKHKLELSTGKLPFADIFSDAVLRRIFVKFNMDYRDRIYSPLTTLWLFVGQILSDDRSCRAVVARASGWIEGIKSLNTNAYCMARQRLPLELIEELSSEVAGRLQAAQLQSWKWFDRAVKIVDGTTLTMPDTKKNQLCFPQSSSQKPGLGFPILRMVVVICGASAAVLQKAIGPCQGFGSSEIFLLRQLLNHFTSGDVVLFDRYYCSFSIIVALRHKDADVVARRHQRRRTNYRGAKKLAPNDYLVRWPRPDKKPDSLSLEEYKQLPQELTVREIVCRVNKKGFRIKEIYIVTTLLDARAYPAESIAELYGQRWNIELDLRSIKSDLGMDVLRCKSPDMVKKEISSYMLAYNFIRLLIAQAAAKADLKPRKISFRGALQSFINARDQLTQLSGEKWIQKYLKMLQLIATQTIGNRPNRREPRVVKRRSLGTQDLMTIPRALTRRTLAKQVA